LIRSKIEGRSDICGFIIAEGGRGCKWGGEKFEKKHFPTKTKTTTINGSLV
jgi:hypothetical protein